MSLGDRRWSLHLGRPIVRMVVAGTRKGLHHAVRPRSAHRGRLRKVQAGFDDDSQRRRRLGSNGWRLLRSIDNPQEYVALFQWDDVEKARGFATSFELQEAVEWAGVVGSATVTVLEEVEAAGAFAGPASG